MSGRRIGQKEVVRIDVDWLLSESANPSDRDFSRFRRIFVALVCILIAVWSWPYASREWLKREWQQQLALISGQHFEDVLPILLALHELDPSRTLEIVQEIASADSSKRLIEPNDPPSLNPPQSLNSNIASIVMPTVPPFSKSVTQTDQAATTPVSHLPNLNISIPRTVAKAILVQTPAVGNEPVEASVSSQDRLAYDTQEFTMISGIDKRTLENLIPLLASSQTRIVQQAFNELVRRGMTPSHLEMAIELAQGNVEQRLKAMETIARDPSFHDRIPWLVWMAESADRNVRRRAVALLGSMTDPVAMRKLRILQSREPDSTIADQISQVLLASGAASNSFR